MPALNPSEQEKQAAWAVVVQQLERKLLAWPKGPWSFEDQITAYREGWALSIFPAKHRDYGKILPVMNIVLDVFESDTEKAVAFVRLRAEQGHELHQRAFALHIAAVMGHHA